MLSSGRLNVRMEEDKDTTMLGMEFSGTDPQGNRVMGIVFEKGIATSVLADSHLLLDVPDQWTLEEAATVPTVYTTAYYALYYRGQLQPGQSILIHSGTGGIGQAAINLALAEGCEIFTTVGNEEKRCFLKTIFPTLLDENIFSSRDCLFQTKIMERTNGRGVDIVLNSLSDEKFHASVRCVATDGKFLEIGKFEAMENKGLGMSCFLKNIDFQGVNVSRITPGHPVFPIFKQGLKNGIVKPLKRTVFNVDQVEDAFRFMENGKHVGKVLIKVRDEENNTTVPQNLEPESDSAKQITSISTYSPPTRVLSIPQTYCHSDKTYIIAGGLGGLGFEVANWLVDRGAKNLILTSRSGSITGYHNHWLQNWMEKGVLIKTLKTDLSNYEEARAFFEKISTTDKKVGGIFNSSLVLHDALIEHQTVETFQAVAAPKANLTKNLDMLSREFCPDVDYFVVFSSIACGKGNACQSNYGMANSVMEMICEQRKVDGLHGLAIQWGVIGETGYVVDTLGFGNGAVFPGSAPQPIRSCLEVLDHALNQNCTVLSSVIIDKTTSATAVKTGILQTFSSAFGIKDLSSVHPNSKLSDLGMDSLIVIEIKQTLERDHGLSLTPPEIRTLTFGNLQSIEAGSFTKADVNKSRDKTNLETIRNLFFPQEILVKLPSKPTRTTSVNVKAKIFFVHGTDGFVQHLKPLASQLDACDLYGFQFSEEVSPTSVQDVAAQYIKEMKKIQPEGPYNIGGYSSGGVVAFEIINQLESHHNDKVSNFIVLDGAINAKSIGNFEQTVIQSMNSYFNEVLGFEKFKETGSEILTYEKFYENLFHKFKTGLDETTSDEIKSRLKDFTKYLRILSTYDPIQNFQGNTILVVASANKDGMSFKTDLQTIFQTSCKGPLYIHEVEGDHHTFLNAANVHETAKILNQLFK